MGKLKVGMVGTGGIFQYAHLPAYEKHPEIEIAAVCDTQEERAKALAERLGLERYYTDYRTMLAEEELDLINICTPNAFHAEIAIAALQAGKHVFCEKPDAMNPSEVRSMSEATKVADKTLMVMRNNRFRSSSSFLKSYIEQGLLGEIYTGRCGWVRSRGIPGKGGWFTTKALSGGGPLIDLGVHFIDLAVWLMGNPQPVSVVGATYRKFAETDMADSAHSGFGDAQANGVFDVEDLATGFIRFDNGASLQIEFSWASNIEEEHHFVELRGTRAGASLKNHQLKLISEFDGVLLDSVPRLPKDQGGHTENINHFIDVVQGRKQPIFTPDQGVDMIDIISAIYKSAETGVEVRLKP
ncbi:Gfo/Idh/MocA family protein [Paenibacillus koleovorans]|uniref:Gfo/Idh/MocA family protein n=1 Tax=Paenibacillus koleovorans TaxID=121608 RepID=UPI000FDB5906|nr:Gfo/Idh/MocA family oxidoreductase [Paenibacillus koleovorans]